MRVLVTIVLLALTAANAFAVECLGIAFDPAQTNSPVVSRVYPVNFSGVQFVQPDGRRRFLAYDWERPGVIKGEPPWIGFRKGSQTEIWADPEMTGGKRRAAFSFDRGVLSSLFMDGQTYAFPRGLELSDSLQSIFPEVKKREWDKNTKADLWQGTGRLRLWFTNPNSAGFLMVTLALLAFAVLVSAKWYLKIVALPCLGGALYALALTGARAAMLSLVLGVVVYLGFSIRRLFNWKGLAILVVLGGIGFWTISRSGMADRFTTHLFRMDDMIQLRFDVGGASLRMFADGPFGWHVGPVNPGRLACLSWYLPQRERVIRTHLLTIGESGWFVGLAYILFWCLGLAIGVHSAIRRGQPLALSLWLAFAFAAMFNPVHCEWALWLAPGGLMTLMALTAVRKREWRALGVCLAVSAPVAVLSVAGLIAGGRCLDNGAAPKVKSQGGSICVNGTDPVSWVVGDIGVLGGWGLPGREIMFFYRRNPEAPAIAYLEDVSELPREVDSLVLAGRAAADYVAAYRRNERGLCRAKRILLLSPSIEPADMPAEMLAQSEVCYLCGNLAQARWKAKGPLPNWVRVLPGIELYIPNWMNIVTGFDPKKKGKT